MKKYIATFKTSRQISPDDFDVVNPVMEVNELTTIKEVNDFFSGYVKGLPMEVKIIEVEKFKTEE